MNARIIAWLSAVALIVVSGSALGEEQTLKFRLITTEVDGASFEAPGEAGHELSTWRSVGVAVFEDGRIAYKSFVVTIDSAGETGNYSGYSTYTFENGDAAAENPKIAVLNLEGMLVPDDLVVSYRFFLNRPDADAFSEPDPAKGYLGNISLVPLGVAGFHPRIDARAILPERAIQDMAKQDENRVTIVPVGITVAPLKLKAPLAPPVKLDFRKLSLSVGEPGLA